MHRCRQARCVPLILFPLARCDDVAAALGRLLTNHFGLAALPNIFLLNSAYRASFRCTEQSSVNI